MVAGVVAAGEVPAVEATTVAVAGEYGATVVVAAPDVAVVAVVGAVTAGCRVAALGAT